MMVAVAVLAAVGVWAPGPVFDPPVQRLPMACSQPAPASLDRELRFRPVEGLRLRLLPELPACTSHYVSDQAGWRSFGTELKLWGGRIGIFFGTSSEVTELGDNRALGAPTLVGGVRFHFGRGLLLY